MKQLILLFLALPVFGQVGITTKNLNTNDFRLNTNTAPYDVRVQTNRFPTFSQFSTNFFTSNNLSLSLNTNAGSQFSNSVVNIINSNSTGGGGTIITNFATTNTSIGLTNAIINIINNNGGGSSFWTTNTVEGGIWWSNVNGNAKFGPLATGTFVSGDTNTTGKIVADGQGATALGSSSGANSLIYSDSTGTLAGGDAASGGQIIADFLGGAAWGVATGAGSQVNNDGAGSFAFGDASTGGQVLINKNGAFAFGRASGGATITANGDGSFAGGEINEGQILADAKGAFAFGEVGGGTGGSELSATVAGAIAVGEAVFDGVLTAKADGAFASGDADTGARIEAAQPGSMANGDAYQGGTLRANAQGAHIFGRAQSTNSLMQSDIGGGFVAGSVLSNGVMYGHSGSGWGANFVLGFAVGAGSRIDANGSGALAGGIGTNGWQTSAGGPASFTWGENVGNDTAGYSYAFGQGFTNTVAKTFNVGWGRQQFTIDTNIVTVNGNVAYSTNLITGAAPDFYLGAVDFVTNNVAHLLAPINVNPNKWETCAVAVTNSTAAAVAITIAGNIHTQGTLFVTNVTVVSYVHDGNKWTNAIATPLW